MIVCGWEMPTRPAAGSGRFCDGGRGRIQERPPFRVRRIGDPLVLVPECVRHPWGCGGIRRANSSRAARSANYFQCGGIDKNFDTEYLPSASQDMPSASALQLYFPPPCNSFSFPVPPNSVQGPFKVTMAPSFMVALPK
jgi:hypothetical protein